MVLVPVVVVVGGTCAVAVVVGVVDDVAAVACAAVALTNFCFGIFACFNDCSTLFREDMAPLVRTILARSLLGNMILFCTDVNNTKYW